MAVLLSELGHAIDTQLNGSTDGPGDEGECFSTLLRGHQPSAASLSENDQRMLIICGQVVPQLLPSRGSERIQWELVASLDTGVRCSAAGDT